MSKSILCQVSNEQLNGGLISLYENMIETNPMCSIGLNVLQGLIQRGGKSGKIQKAVETLRTIQDKASRSKFKRSMPSVTVSGTFSQRSNEGLLIHSGLLQVDIDYTGNESRVDNGICSLAETVANYPHALLTCISPSGNGIKSIVGIDLQSALSTLPIDLATAHALLAETVSADYQRLFGLAVDSAGSRMAQLMIVPFDPNVYHNPNATPANVCSEVVRGFTNRLAESESAERFVESRVKSLRATNTKGRDKYYVTAVDSVLKRLAGAIVGERHKMGVGCALQLHGLIAGAQSLGVDCADSAHAFCAVYQMIGGTEKQAADIWRWAQSKNVNPIIPHDSTGWVGKVVAVGKSHFRVISAWQKAADTLLLTLDNGAKINANACKVVGK